MPMTAHAQLLRIRLFLEGLEVPIISIQTQSAPNSPTVATIQIPPLAEATRLHPRTTVHCFFLDLYKDSPALNTSHKPSSEDQGEVDPNAAERQQQGKQDASDGGDDAGSKVSVKDVANDQWKLLFGGEIVGFTWNKTSTNRSIILQCEDWSNYWDYAYQASNHSIFGPGLKAVFSGASTNLFTDLIFPGQNHVITNLVASGRCNTFPQLKGLAAGIVRLIEAIGGSYYVYPRRDKKEAPKRIAGQNVFFSYNELRLHLTQLVGTIDKDPTGERLLRVQGYTGLFNRMLGGGGGQTSIRKAITSLSKVMFYEMYPQPCPKYKPGSYGEVSGTRRATIRETPEYAVFGSIAEDLAGGLIAIAGDIARYDIGQGQEGTEGIDLADTTKKAREWSQQLANIKKELQRSKAKQGQGLPASASSKFSSAITKVGKAVTTISKLGRGDPQMFGAAGRSTPGSRHRVIGETASLLRRASEELIDFADTSVDVGAYNERRPAQLYQHVFRPDVWFSAPPRCNVLFPEAYDSLNYSRMFLQEPTRFMLKTNDELLGENMFTDKFYFAPKSQTTHKERLKYQNILKRQLLLHERFTGILPIFEKMGEFNVFSARAEKQKRKGLGKSGLAQRTANFLYFRHRFNARRMQIMGKFNPYVAVGFPGLIIDKWTDQESIERHNQIRKEVAQRFGKDIPTIESSAALGTNFLGSFTQVVHQVSQPQQRGSTQITLTFCRQPEESVAFLGSIDKDESTNVKISDADAVKSTNIAAISPPKLFSLGPNGGKITNVIDETFSFIDQELPFFRSGAKRNTSFKEIKVPVGRIITARELGSGNVAEEADGDLDAPLFFAAFKITEEIPRYRREEVLLPAEEYIRPGWYGDIWTNQKIGAVYQELFSTGAITDPQVVNDYGRTDAQMHSEGALQDVEAADDATDGDDPRRDAARLPSLDEGSSIQQAVEFLHLTYSYVKQANVDADEFIGAYTWRPIVSMLDLFGTSDLTYSHNGQEVIGGIEGFHSRAVAGEADNPESGRSMFGLVNPEIKDILGMKEDNIAAQQVDTRAEKREMVAQYLTSLLFSAALLG